MHSTLNERVDSRNNFVGVGPSCWAPRAFLCTCRALHGLTNALLFLLNLWDSSASDLVQPDSLKGDHSHQSATRVQDSAEGVHAWQANKSWGGRLV